MPVGQEAENTDATAVELEVLITNPVPLLLML